MGHSEVPAQDAARVRRALESLGRDKGAAIWLTYFGGLDCRQVSIELGLPEGTIRTYVRDGLIHLRQQLAEPAGPQVRQQLVEPAEPFG